jgi:peptidoglycan/LPS O-acetylase OafA/YrhL
MAAIIVVVSHYSKETGLWSDRLGWRVGELGVMLFFLLSGFLMAHLYLNIPPTPQSIRAFAAARVARVVPLFLVVVIAPYLLSLIAPSSVNSYFYGITNIPALLSHLFLLSGWDVLWTIPIEIHFYVLFALAWFMRPRLGTRLNWISGALVILIFISGHAPAIRRFLGLTILNQTRRQCHP